MPEHSSPDRRTFLASVLGAGGMLALQPPSLGTAWAATDPTKCATTPLVFKPGFDTRPITARQTVGQIAANPALLAKLRKAYAGMRALNPNDPRSLTQQGNIHKIMCVGVSPSQYVHQSDRFLAWHRCFLYFHERILAYYATGGVSLDPTFRLAAWNWEGASSTPSFPAAWAPATVSGQPNSLYDPNRQPTFSAGDGNINPALATTDIFTFYGDPFGSGGSGSPVLENAAHGQIHVDTGKQTPPYNDMGALATAGLDPVFYAHHSNIDKVWSCWMGLHGNQTPASINPATHKPWDPAWAGTTWQFYDYDGKCYSIKAGDVVDNKNNLRYTYSTGCTPIRLIPIHLPLLESVLRIPPNPPEQLVAAQNATIILRGVTIPAPGTGRFNLIGTVNGEVRRVGSFALFSHTMETATKTNVLAHIDAEALPALRSGKLSLSIIAENAGGTLKAFGAINGGALRAQAPTKLHATSATLLVE